MHKIILILSALVFWSTSPALFADNMCADGNTCDFRYPNGVCQMWLDYTVCGPVCVAGNVCDAEYSDGRCASYRTDAICGERCTRQEVCRLRYSDGRCAETEFKLNCTDE